MMYVLETMCVILIGAVGSWFFYSTHVGPKKDRLCVAIVWGAGVAVISALAAFGG